MRDPLWYPPLPAALRAGSEAVAKAMAAPTKTEGEKDYIAAIATFYRDNDSLTTAPAPSPTRRRWSRSI
jgi:hypothetical protein